GPFHLALFPHQVGDDLPDTLPMSPLVAVLLKDPAQVEQTLDAAAAGPAPRFRREVLNGGSHYIDITVDNPGGAGFWLKDKYLAYSTEKDLLDLAGLAIKHEKGNERIADRAAYKQAIAAKKIWSDALFTVFAEADQALEMPYRVAKFNWQEDDENPWPDWAVVKPLLQNKPILISVKATPEGLQAWGQTPLTIYGIVVAFRWPLLEAGYIK
ncbi:MAG TPA: hypothetical protein VEJ63_22015, partial [Planctomycetota bacterium]|nr:hypothetical protein [Planctomycetota bacterium]